MVFISIQIYPIIGSKSELAVGKTKTLILVYLRREIIKMINIMYRYKIGSIVKLLSQIVLDKQS